MGALFSRVCEVLNAKVTGEQAMACCPAHDDRKASLGIKETDSGLILLNCLAGCSYDSVKAALESKGVTFHKTSRKPMQAAAKPKLRVAEKRGIVATYPYRDAEGRVLFEKVRYEPKDFRIRRPNGNGGWEWGMPKGIEAPLYRLPEVLDAAQKKKVIHWPEGEKDANALAALGWCATASYEGAGSNKWHDSYATALRGASCVVLYADNDGPGEGRVDRLRLHLNGAGIRTRTIYFRSMPPHSDVTDYLNANSVSSLRELVLGTPDDKGPEPRDGVTSTFKLPSYEKARYQDYISFLHSIYPAESIKREFLSRELLLNDDGEWQPLANYEDVIKSYARDYGKFFTLDAFRQHIARWGSLQKPELLISFPEWDGRDRLEEIFSICRFGNMTQQHTYELVAEWGATMFRRLANPEVQPQILVLTGSGGLGKDVLLSSLVGGLGLYYKDLSMSGYDMTEAKRQLHTALVFRISEFDKTGKKDVATLKEVLNTPEVTERLAYDRRSATRKVRASFVASANRPRVLTDDTGNRRYLVFECEYLGMEMTKTDPPMGTGKVLHPYPGGFWDPKRSENRMQILAQFKCLAEQNYKAPADARAAMVEYITDKTPDSTDELILEDWDSRLETLTDIDVKKTPEGRKLFLYSQVSEIIGNIGSDHNMTRRQMLSLLKSSQRQVRSSSERFYVSGKSATINEEKEEY